MFEEHETPITIDDIPQLHKRALNTPYLLPAAIYVASGNYVSTSNTPYDSPDIIRYDDTNIIHVMNGDLPLLGRERI